MISEMKKNRILKDLTLDDIYLRTGINIPKLSRIEREILRASEKEKRLISKALREPLLKIFPEDN